MNTKQTIALWYSGLFLVLAFVFLAGEQQIPPWLAVIASILTLASLLIYSLGDRAEIDGSTLLKAVGAPIGGLSCPRFLYQGEC
jgi:Ca2+/H+ antiporter